MTFLQIARNAAWIAGGVTAAAAAGAIYASRRKQQPIARFPCRGRMGFYRGGNFQYSFLASDAVVVRKDLFNRPMLILKMFVPALMLLGLWIFLIDSAAAPTHDVPGFSDALALECLLGSGIFALVAMFRSNLRLMFFWRPDKHGRASQPAHFSAKELLKLQEQPPL